ncbi:MAG: hypothetical protein ACH350_07810 [Parachlamydiaceae bacterium]
MNTFLLPFFSNHSTITGGLTPSLHVDDHLPDLIKHHPHVAAALFIFLNALFSISMKMLSNAFQHKNEAYQSSFIQKKIIFLKKKEILYTSTVVFFNYLLSRTTPSPLNKLIITVITIVHIALDYRAALSETIKDLEKKLKEMEVKYVALTQEKSNAKYDSSIQAAFETQIEELKKELVIQKSSNHAFINKNELLESKIKNLLSIQKKHQEEDVQKRKNEKKFIDEINQIKKIIDPILNKVHPKTAHQHCITSPKNRSFLLIKKTPTSKKRDLAQIKRTQQIINQLKNNLTTK